MLDPEIIDAKQKARWHGDPSLEPLGSDRIARNDVPLPDGLVVSDRFEPGGGFRGSMRANVRLASGGVTTGTVVAVAVGVGRCLVLAADTRADGEDAERRVTDRLAWLVEGVAKSLVVRNAEQRISPRH
jgi:hypothetical protein